MPTTVLHHQTFLQLVSVADDDMRDALTDQILHDLRRSHDVIKTQYTNLMAHESQAIVQMRRATHEMKGLAATLGADCLQQQCIQIERCCDHSDYQELCQQVPVLLASNQQLRREIAGLAGRVA